MSTSSYECFECAAPLRAKATLCENCRGDSVFRSLSEAMLLAGRGDRAIEQFGMNRGYVDADCEHGHAGCSDRPGGACVEELGELLRED